MSTIVTRAGKGSPLTHNEVDANFNNLNSDKYQSGNNASFGTLTASGAVTFSSTVVMSGSTTANTFSSSGVTISGGSINGTAIGGSTAAAGKFTTLEATGVSTVSAGTVSAPAITTTGDTNTGIFFPAADTIAFTEGGVESMRIDSAGNVGIGITPSAWVGGYKVLQVGASSWYTDSNGSIQFAANTYQASGFADTYILSKEAAKYEQSLGTHRWSTAPSGTAGTAITFTERMCINTSGNVGIGISSPSGSDWNANSRLLHIYQNTTNGSLLKLESSNAVGVYAVGNDQGQIGMVSNDPFIFYTNSAERIRISSTGLVGIGTSSPATLLHLNGTNSTDANNVLTGSWLLTGSAITSGLGIRQKGASAGISGSTYPIQIATAGGLPFEIYTTDSQPLVLGTAATERMRITSTGSLLLNQASSLIATNTSDGSDSSVLAISGGGASSSARGGFIELYGNENATAGHVEMSSGNVANSYVRIQGRSSSSYIRFDTNATERMRIDSSGNVGIGTSSPVGKFDVSWGGYTTNPTMLIGADIGNNSSRTNNTRKSATILNPHYTNTEENVCFAFLDSDGTNNEIYLGGGDSSWNAATAIYFYTGATTTTTSGTERMRITSSGDVGIGTSSPLAKLDVRSASATVGSGSGNISVFSTDSQGIDLGGTLLLGGNADTQIAFGSIAGRKENSTSNNRSGYLQFSTYINGTGNVERMRITSGGEVYIAGTTDQGAYNLQVNGTGVWGAGAYVNGSDERIKDKIAPLDSGLDVVAKLNPVTYKYKKDWSKDQSTQTGFIAQELLTALEGKNYVDGVVQQGGEYMSVAYQNIIPILTKAIQEQQAMIEELKQEVAALKAK